MKEKGKAQRFYHQYENFIKRLFTSKICLRIIKIADETSESKNFFVKMLFLVVFIPACLSYFIIVMFSVPFVFPGLLGMNYLREKYNIENTYDPASKIACVIVGLVIYIAFFIIVGIIYSIVQII